MDTLTKKIFNYLYLVEFIIGTALNTVLLGVFYKIGSFKRSPNDKIIIMLTMYLFLWSSYSVVNTIAAIFEISQLTNCQVQGAVIYLAAGGSLLSHFLIAYDRLRAIAFQNALSKFELNIWMLGTNTFMITCLVVFSVFSPTKFAPVSDLWCFISLNINESFDRTFCIVMLVVCVLISSVIIYTYTLIYVKYYLINASFDHDKLVYRKCVTVSIAFIILYFPVFVTMFYGLISGEEIPPVYAYIVEAFAVSDTFITPMIFFTFTDRYKMAMLRMISSKSISGSGIRNKSGNRINKQSGVVEPAKVERILNEIKSVY